MPQPSTSTVKTDKERDLTIGHTTNCETAKTYTCVCPCGGARHGAILIRGIASIDAATQVEATDWDLPKIPNAYLPISDFSKAVSDQINAGQRLIGG